MFKHLLIPTDGSDASRAAILQAIGFAKQTGASVTAFYAAPEFHVFTYRADMLEDTRSQYRKDAEQHGAEYLRAIESAAQEAGVPCQTAFVYSDHPYEAIINAAREHKCDLIAMASHGRKGMQGLLLGSETQKVLTHSQIPVLVLR